MRKYYILQNFLINMTKQWTKQEQKVRKCLPARVCSYPVLRSQGRNVPGQSPTNKVQRLTVGANSKHT